MKIFRIVLFIGLLLLSSSLLLARSASLGEHVWGDQGKGTYINPVLNADYSDPDVIRVGTDYCMVCSEFHFMGMPVLHSNDLVNWSIIGRIYDEFKFAPEYDTNERYAGGSWAPAIRYHNNKFYVYFCTPKEGLFMSTAANPQGPWEPLVQVVDTAGWEDPCPFWDDNGQAYLGPSKVGARPVIIHKMSADGKKLLDEGFTVYTGTVAEGTKRYKRNSYYYLSIPEGGVQSGWQTILRSKNIYVPYGKKVVLEKGSTPVNGPHQGAWVDLPNDDWCFIHFQSVRNIGSVCHLEPIYWKNNWPVVGIDIDRNGIGEPVYVWKKTDVGRDYPITTPQTSDEFSFSDAKLSFQWSWNHNPVNEAWSLAKRHGFLSLIALHSDFFVKAKNTLTQKVMGYKGEVTTLLLTGQREDGQKTGLYLIGKEFKEAGLVRKKSKILVFVNINGKYSEQIYSLSKIYLKVKISQKEGADQFYFSKDNKKYLALGSSYTHNGYWEDPRIGLFSYNETGTGGIACFDWFHYSFDGPEYNSKN